MIHYQVSVSDCTTEVSGQFACAHCGHRDRYAFKVEARGQATLGATSRDSSDVARERAHKMATKISEQTIALLSCPNCRKMNPGAIARFLRIQAPIVSFFAFLFALGAAMVSLAKDMNPVLSALPTFVLTAVALGALGFRGARTRPVVFAHGQGLIPS